MKDRKSGPETKKVMGLQTLPSHYNGVFEMTKMAATLLRWVELPKFVSQ